MLKAQKNIRQSLLHPSKVAAEGGDGEQKPPFYKQKWFFAVVAIVAALIIFGLYSVGSSEEAKEKAASSSKDADAAAKAKADPYNFAHYKKDDLNAAEKAVKGQDKKLKDVLEKKAQKAGQETQDLMKGLIKLAKEKKAKLDEAGWKALIEEAKKFKPAVQTLLDAYAKDTKTVVTAIDDADTKFKAEMKKTGKEVEKQKPKDDKDKEKTTSYKALTDGQETYKKGVEALVKKQKDVSAATDTLVKTLTTAIGDEKMPKTVLLLKADFATKGTDTAVLDDLIAEWGVVETAGKTLEDGVKEQVKVLDGAEKKEVKATEDTPTKAGEKGKGESDKTKDNTNKEGEGTKKGGEAAGGEGTKKAGEDGAKKGGEAAGGEGTKKAGEDGAKKGGEAAGGEGTKKAGEEGTKKAGDDGAKKGGEAAGGEGTKKTGEEGTKKAGDDGTKKGGEAEGKEKETKK